MIQIQKYLNTLQNGNPNPDSPLPLLNSLFINTSGMFGNTGERPSFPMFMRHVRKSPQMQGFLRLIINDIMSDDIHFDNMDELSSGKQKINKAKSFWNVNNGNEVLEETLMDVLTMGVGYNWLGKLTDEQVKEMCKEAAKTLIEHKENKTKLEFKARQIYEQVTKPGEADLVKKYRCVPSSTVSINHNSLEIINYIQRVGVYIKVFDPKEIITYKLTPMDGNIYPACPMEALLAEVYLLWLITQTNVSFFENGGSPDKVFVLPKEIAGSKNHSYLVETLKKYKKIQNKHGNLVFTGDIKIEDLMKIENQMEHRELGLYLVGVLALYYGVPSGRIPFLIGKSSNNGDAGGLADSGYWRMISVLQSKIENNLNRDLFNKYFGVNIKFARGYKQDEVRETQVTMQKLQISEQAINLGLWPKKYAAKYMEVPEEVFELAQKEYDENQQKQLESGMLNQNNLSNKKMENPDKQLKNSKKSATQVNNNKINPDPNKNTDFSKEEGVA